MYFYADFYIGVRPISANIMSINITTEMKRATVWETNIKLVERDLLFRPLTCKLQTAIIIIFSRSMNQFYFIGIKRESPDVSDYFLVLNVESISYRILNIYFFVIHKILQLGVINYKTVRQL